MTLIADILVGTIGLLHLWILILEMFLWTKPLGLKAFQFSLKDAQTSKVLAANQGLYNGFLAAGLLISLIMTEPTSNTFKIFFLICVSIAGIYGGLTVHKKILAIQATPAMIALALIALA